MKKRTVATILAISMMAVSVLAGGCGSSGTGTPASQESAVGDSDGQAEQPQSQEGTEASTDTEKKGDAQEKSDAQAEDGAEEGPGNALKTPDTFLLGSSEEIYYDRDLVPSVKPYAVNEDFSNVKLADRFRYTFGLDPDNENEGGAKLRKALAENGFVIDDTYGDSEFFDVYESNRYSQFPSFVTVDSLMHTYHLYFSHLMKNTEKQYIIPELKKLSAAMLEASQKQYEELKGTDWEKAALRNVAFFYIGSYLQDGSVKTSVSDSSFDGVVKSEIDKIMAASGIEMCEVSGDNEDYSQYKPRGYYEGDEELEAYFRAMMWYGRIPLEITDIEPVKSAVLMNLAIDEAGKESWEAIYRVTSFFAGSSDDAGYSDFMPLLKEAYGGVPAAADLAGSDDKVQSLMASLGRLEPPKINSIPVNDGDNPVIPSFRFMGQRFTVDAAIMQRLVYSAVGENGSGDKRLLPDALDTAATLGSEEAMNILAQSGATEYKGYTDNMSILQDIYRSDDPSIWNASLYAGWLNTLRPMFVKKGEGYPSFMQTGDWAKKNLETFAGSYAELKHDTILYAKQIMAEMGDGDDEEVLDDRGYVEPEPVVYSRFIFLSDNTRKGLESYGMLPDGAGEDLDRLSEMGRRLLAISEKELKEEALTEADYSFIRDYGGDLEHFWYEAMKDTVNDLSYSYQAPCPVVADIATDPNGSVLEVGTGMVHNLYVAFPVDGEIHIGKGGAYSFYQFETDISDRLTDEEWRNRLSGGYLNDNWEWVENDNMPIQPDWTKSYRVNTN